MEQPKIIDIIPGKISRRGAEDVRAANVKWKAVMKRPTGAELRIRRQANKTLEQPKIIDITLEKSHAEMRRMFAQRT